MPWSSRRCWLAISISIPISIRRNESQAQACHWATSLFFSRPLDIDRAVGKQAKQPVFPASPGTSRILTKTRTSSRVPAAPPDACYRPVSGLHPPRSPHLCLQRRSPSSVLWLPRRHRPCPRDPDSHPQFPIRRPAPHPVPHAASNSVRGTTELRRATALCSAASVPASARCVRCAWLAATIARLRHVCLAQAGDVCGRLHGEGTQRQLLLGLLVRPLLS
jgi:hypothetical protein